MQRVVDRAGGEPDLACQIKSSTGFHFPLNRVHLGDTSVELAVIAVFASKMCTRWTVTSVSVS